VIKMRKRKFPGLAVLLLLIGVVWTLNGFGITNLNVPWLPVVLLIIAIGMIVNRYR